MAAKPESKEVSPELQLESFIDKLEAKEQKLFRSIRSALRKRLPTANEFAYDYGHSIVISYSPTDHGKDGIVSIATREGGVRLYFNQGPALPDPKNLLQASSKQARFIPIEAAGRLAHPDVEALIVAATALAAAPLPAEGAGTLMIKGAAAKPQSRRGTK